MDLGDCCKRMSVYVAEANYSGSARARARQRWLRSLHRCPWCFARVNAEEKEVTREKP